MDMDITKLAAETAAFLAPFLPYLIKGGKIAAQKAFEKMGEKFAEKNWDQAEKLWGKIWTKAKNKPAAKEAIKDAAAHQTDEGAQAALTWQLKKLLEADKSLSKFVAKNIVSLSIGGNVSDAQIAIGNGNTQTQIGKMEVYVNPKYAQTPTQDIPDKELISAYLRALASECSRLPLGVVDPRFLENVREDSISISGIYIDLDVQPPADGKKAKQRNEEMLLERERENRVPVLKALTDKKLRRLVLLGDPGSGKTTCLHYITYALCMSQQNDKSAKDLLPEKWSLKNHFPARLILREVAAQYIPADAKKGTAEMIWNALRADLAARLGDDITKILFPKLQKYILKNPCLIMFDGLDEVTEADGRRERLIEAITAFSAPLMQETCILVTARPYAYTDPKWHLPDFKTLTLLPFSREQIERFIMRWYQAMRETMKWDEATANDKAQSLNSATQEKEYLFDLAQRPLLLTLMATLHTSWGKLPEDRADLYDETVRLLLDRWQRWREARDPQGNVVMEKSISIALSIEENNIRRALNQLAFAVHTRQGQDTQSRQNGPADIRQDEVLQAFEKYLPDNTHPRVIINYLETRAGLLLGRGNGIYAFPHRSFQEYLAACYINDLLDPATEYSEYILKDPTWWREVFLLGIGKMSRGGLGTAIAALQTVLMNLPDEKERNDKDWQALSLAGQAVTEMKLSADAQRYEKLIAPIRNSLVTLLEQNALTPRERAEAGDTLARLGDPRFDADKWHLPKEPLLGFVHIPAGDFLMGTKKKDIKGLIEKFGGEKDWYEGEVEQHKVTLPDYYMARYPVTVAQFKAFVDDSEHKPDREESLHGVPNHPVAYVTWFDAIAYCHWLNEKLKAIAKTTQSGGENEMQNKFWQGMAEGKLIVTLPSEAEWEKAARWPPSPAGRGVGGEGVRVFPWGDEVTPNHANYGDTNINHTSAVGCFPAGRSPYLLHDMAGNVWEWTRSIYEKYPYEISEKREDLEDKESMRVLRGGAFSYNDGFVRCAYRIRYYPYYRNNCVGFRVVVCVVSPISL